MNSDPYYHLAEEDRRLAVGRAVTAFWSRGGFFYRGEGKIVKLESRSVAVRLKAVKGGNGGFQPGSIVRLPRFCDRGRWSSEHCVHLVGHPTRSLGPNGAC